MGVEWKRVNRLDSSTIIAVVALVIVGVLVLSLAGVVLTVQSFRSLNEVVTNLLTLATDKIPPTHQSTPKEVTDTRYGNAETHAAEHPPRDTTGYGT